MAGAKASAATTVLKGGSVGLRRQLKDNAKFYSSEWRGKLQLRLKKAVPHAWDSLERADAAAAATSAARPAHPTS